MTSAHITTYDRNIVRITIGDTTRHFSTLRSADGHEVREIVSFLKAEAEAGRWDIDAGLTFNCLPAHRDFVVDLYVYNL